LIWKLQGNLLRDKNRFPNLRLYQLETLDVASDSDNIVGIDDIFDIFNNTTKQVPSIVDGLQEGILWFFAIYECLVHDT
jgi:hypothetical protein